MEQKYCIHRRNPSDTLPNPIFLMAIRDSLTTSNGKMIGYEFGNLSCSKESTENIIKRY